MTFLLFSGSIINAGASTGCFTVATSLEDGSVSETNLFNDDDKSARARGPPDPRDGQELGTGPGLGASSLWGSVGAKNWAGQDKAPHLQVGCQDASPQGRSCGTLVI